ncbi:siderophore-interacting protein [Rhizobium leguminosarum]|jgi:NADPH-dependent ferric siderophore reductase|uniref:FAD-binding 9 siderophore-interacting domain protein n=1 Tax=Rhizobium leguminosarum bv. trifolii (strain WSM1325) TaxID=395491 RepID=C6B1X1_RHILS|nr:siderophore-interacting protein [Rhizobium leguminosarum]ACS56720.1 FAD-binding 9 siderophore-interacting domain protein [Rhizobium leguminosarum bv. trifolii WSM1325]MBY2906389.1 siderophore-interacting protein [Rhizobium leguminosarum]MBY2924067.1 siderophore-interacting protein [Rhizobium leguminosarum]MBY2946033.1 siderophore-interacting protein [Rhizobium leguminosarum]MBY2984002.1 siderophore-interacting protein [Rhizobium leguminosarum]
MDSNQFKDQASSTPGIERIRHDTRRRLLTVESVVDITPSMRRVVLAGDDLADFISLGADDHIKIFIPTADGGEERRDYTPRRYDNAERRLTIDFALHEAGPVTKWAIDANPGDRLEIGGPRGSAVVSKTVKRWLLIGDETALPAIGRRIEEIGAGTVVTTIAAVTGPLEEQTFETSAELHLHWVHRPLSQATDAAALLKLLSTVDVQPETFIWVAAEASVTRDIRAYLLERGCPLGWIKASGYWVFGKADTTEKFG